MIPSGSPSPVGGAQPVAPSLLRTNSISAQSPFSSLQSPRAQFNANEFLSNISNVSSLLNHSFGNGLAASGGGFSAPSVNVQHQGSIRGGVAEIATHAETNSIPFASSSGSMHGQQFQKPSGNQHCLDHIEFQQYDGMQNFQQQFSVAHSQQQKLLGGWGAMNSMPPVKLEPQMVTGDQNGSAQQLHALRNMGAVRMEQQQQQQLQSLTNLAPVKTEHQHSDPTMLLQRQQPPLLHLSKQSSQAAAQMTLLQQQQRIMQLQQQQQQQQQQQIVNGLPWQRSQLQQQLHQQSPPVRPQVKPSGYEPGACARRLTHYMYQQQHRPEDNNIEFWRKFVLDYFAPNAKKRWCVSLYGSGRQTTGVFPQDVWHCEICSRKPGRGFETTVEVLPRLCQIKYASGTLEELLYVDLPREYLNASGQIVLDYAKAIQESVFDQLRVVRDGQLRIIFNQDLKIASWEFCARRHEELIPRRLMIPQVSQLGAVLQKYTAQNPSNLSAQDLQNTCNSFIASARQLAKTLEVPLVNDLGYTKRYVRCLQISEVVNSMKDLIDYSKETGTGPMDSLINFPRGMNASSGLSSQHTQPPKEQQSLGQNLNQSNQNSSHPTSMQIAPSVATADTRNSGVGALLPHNRMESKQAISTTVLIIGAGTSGLAVAACLTSQRIPVIILERDDTTAPLWRYHTYDRLHLHLPKNICDLPFHPHPPSAPIYIPCADFIRYIDEYAAMFGLEHFLRLLRRVDSAQFDPVAARWRVTATNLESGAVEEYEARFMVVATGENDEPVLPIGITGLDQFSGEVIHSSLFRTGKAYKGLDVLVVGCGNSGMEIAFDLTENGARASIVARNSIPLMTREIARFALFLIKYLPFYWVELTVTFLCYLWFGNTSKYGLKRPSRAQGYLKNHSAPFYPVLDVGTFSKIKSGEIEVLSQISTIEGKTVTFENGKQRCFDAIILATGYRSTVKKWLKGDDYLIGDDGMGKRGLLEHWKGENGLYCAGLMRQGFSGASKDAINITKDINNSLLSDLKQKMA